MKKILIASLAILLISSAIEAYALSAAVQAVCGANSATLACTTSDDSKIWNPVTQPGTLSDTSTYTAVKITLNSATRITAYKVRNFDGGSDTGSATTVLYSDDGNGATSKPTTAVADTSKNVLMSAVPAASTVVDYDLATPKEVSAGTYWIVNYEVDSAARLVYYATSTGDRGCYSTDGTNWTCTDNAMYDMELWGCQ